MPLVEKNGYGIVAAEDQILYAIGQGSFFKFDKGDSFQISMKEYREAKFNSRISTNEFLHHDTAKLANENFVTVSYRADNLVKLRSIDGQVIKALPGIKSTYNMSICSIATDVNDNIWIAAPTEHFIGQFDTDGNLLYKFECDNGLEPEVFNHPNHLFSSQNFIYVSDSGNRKITKIDVLTYEISAYLNVPEPVYHFERMQNK